MYDCQRHFFVSFSLFIFCAVPAFILSFSSLSVAGPFSLSARKTVKKTNCKLCGLRVISSFYFFSAHPISSTILFMYRNSCNGFL